MDYWSIWHFWRASSMNFQHHQQYPFAYGPVQPAEFVLAHAQQNMQHMPPQCGNMNCMYAMHPLQQSLPLMPQQYNPYLMQCSYLMPSPIAAYGHHPMHHYPQPPPPSFYNQAPYPQPGYGVMQPPQLLGPHQMVPPQYQHQMRPMPGHPHQMNSYCHGQLQSIYRAQATFEAPVMPPRPPNFDFPPNPMDGSTYSTSTAYPGDDEHRKHVFLRGALYNMEFLKPPLQQDESSQFMDSKSQSDDTEDDPYDPMDEVSRSQAL